MHTRVLTQAGVKMDIVNTTAYVQASQGTLKIESHA